jgi:hypothetical protein
MPICKMLNGKHLKDGINDVCNQIKGDSSVGEATR